MLRGLCWAVRLWAGFGADCLGGCRVSVSVQTRPPGLRRRLDARRPPVGWAPRCEARVDALIAFNALYAVHALHAFVLPNQ